MECDSAVLSGGTESRPSCELELYARRGSDRACKGLAHPAKQWTPHSVRPTGCPGLRRRVPSQEDRRRTHAEQGVLPTYVAHHLTPYRLPALAASHSTHDLGDGLIGFHDHSLIQLTKLSSTCPCSLLHTNDKLNPPLTILHLRLTTRSCSQRAQTVRVRSIHCMAPATPV